MKKLVKVLVAVGVLGFVAQGASAEVTGLTAKFAGGCQVSNTRGSCVIKATASGSDLSSDEVVLEQADTSKGHFRTVGKTPKTLSSTGTTSFKFKNKAGCYKVVTAPNGNDKPDVRSRVICEK